MAKRPQHWWGQGPARALPVLLLLWLPFPPCAAGVQGSAAVRSDSPPTAPLAETAMAKGPVARAPLQGAKGGPGALAAPPVGTGAWPWIAPRPVDEMLAVIRTAPPGRPGRPNLSRAPPTD